MKTPELHVARIRGEDASFEAALNDFGWHRNIWVEFAVAASELDNMFEVFLLAHVSLV
jgi:hypothetical protein